MEKKRRARINVSLEQLRSLLEKHYSHQVSPDAVVGGAIHPSPLPAAGSPLRALPTRRRSENASWRRQTSWS